MRMDLPWIRSGYAFDWGFDLDDVTVWDDDGSACTMTVEGYPLEDRDRKAILVYRFTADEWRELWRMYDSNADQEVVEGYIDGRLAHVMGVGPGDTERGLYPQTPWKVR